MEETLYFALTEKCIARISLIDCGQVFFVHYIKYFLENFETGDFVVGRQYGDARDFERWMKASPHTCSWKPLTSSAFEAMVPELFPSLA